MFRFKKRVEGFLLSVTKNCETLIYQTHTKPQVALAFKRTQPKEIFSFKPSINVDPYSKWLVGLTKIEVINPT